MLSSRRGARSWIPGHAFTICLLLASTAVCSREDSSRSPSSGTSRPPASASRTSPPPQTSSSATPAREDIFRTVTLIIADLKREPILRGHDVRVRGQGRTVVLAGSVPGPAARDRVLGIARGHIGSLTLVDSLQTGPLSGGREP